MSAESEVQPQLARVFETIETEFKKTSLGADRWYLVAIATLVAGPDPELSSQLYLYLVNQPQYSSTSARHALIKRLREALVKCVSIVGVCKPIEAIVAISKVEAAEDKEYTCTRKNWQADQANHDRGIGWLQRVYTHDAESTLELFNAHKDFAWISSEITYGLYLSDRQILDDVETELVVLPGIMTQNLKVETLWHIRGTRRIGVAKEDVEIIYDCVQKLAKYLGVRLDRVPTVQEVEQQV